MKYWCTSISAVDPQSNRITEYEGPIIEATTFNEAETECRIKYPYATVIGQIIVRTSIVDGEIKNLINYEDVKMN